MQHQFCFVSNPTLESAMLWAAGWDEIKGYMGRSAYVLVREGTTGMLIASTQYMLAKKPSSYNHQND